MNNDDHASPRSFLRSSLGIVVLISLGIAGFFLLAEHRAHIFAGQWGTAILLLAFIGLHLLMHTGHGGHGGHGRHETTGRSDGRWERQSQDRTDADRPRGDGNIQSHGDHR